MEHIFFPFGFAFAGLGALGAIAGLAYPILVIWMIVDGILRSDAEYPGTETHCKVLWVLGMVLLHPVAIAYFILVYVKVPRTRRHATAQYTTAPQYTAPAQYTAAPPAPPIPQAPPSA
jgi:hypothetical protein